MSAGRATDLVGAAPSTWTFHDGGRREAGYSGDTGDCVVRAIAIATGTPYREVYDVLALGMEALGKARSARHGVAREVYDPLLADMGWEWTPTMAIGQGCTVHLDAAELPPGRLIARVSKHLCAVVDGVVYDTHDPTRDGTRCVYGMWTPGPAGAVPQPWHPGP